MQFESWNDTHAYSFPPHLLGFLYINFFFEFLKISFSPSYYYSESRIKNWLPHLKINVLPLKVLPVIYVQKYKDIFQYIQFKIYLYNFYYLIASIVLISQIMFLIWSMISFIWRFFWANCWISSLCSSRASLYASPILK